MEIREEVESFRKQGYSEEQIKNYLTQKGYNLGQIFELLKPVEPHHNHKKLIISLLIILLIVIIGNVFYFYYSSTEHYSDNPSKWINQVNDTMSLDLNEASEGNSYLDGNSEQQYGAIGTMFSSEGWYKGNYFNNEYVSNGKTLMKITNDLVPNNGVIEGFLFEKLEGEDLFAYIFVDSDWKNNLPDTKVFFGSDYQYNTTFDFSNELKPGVFMMKIKDDKERFISGYSIHKGGFYIGELGEETSTLISFN